MAQEKTVYGFKISLNEVFTFSFTPLVLGLLYLTSMFFEEDKFESKKDIKTVIVQKLVEVP